MPAKLLEEYEGKSQEQNAGIIEAISSKMCLINYSSFAKHEMQQYRMVKCKVAPPKCLLHVATQIEKDRYTLIEQSAHLVLLKIGIYSYITT